MDTSFVDSSLFGVAIALPIVASFFVVIRFFANRRKRGVGFTGDDWTVFITLILCWAHSINTIIAGALGGVNKIKVSPHQYANLALRTLWISSYFLVTALYTVKVSILLFYWRMFSIHTGFRKACVSMIILLTVWWISSVILIVLSTVPIDAAWKDAARAHHRFDYNTWYLSYSGLSMFFDIVILCFPIPLINTLRVSRKKKISIIAIFWLGGFVCVSAIVRFVLTYQSIYRLTDYGANQYSLITRAFIWAEIEPNTSVIAACLPTYGPLFKEGGFVLRIWRSMRSSTGSRQGTGGLGTDDTTTGGYHQLDKVKSGNKKDLDTLMTGTTLEPDTLISQPGKAYGKGSFDEESFPLK